MSSFPFTFPLVFASEWSEAATGQLAVTGQLGTDVWEVVSIPDAPVLSAIAGDGEVTLSWSDVEGATSYTVYKGSAPGITPDTGTPIQGVTSPYVDDGLVNWITLYYVVTATKDNVEGNESNEVYVTPTAAHGSIQPGNALTVFKAYPNGRRRVPCSAPLRSIPCRAMRVR